MSESTNPHPYQPPRWPDPPDPGWRSTWKWICLGSLGLAGILFAASKVFEGHNQESADLPWFKIASGLLALGELLSWAMAGIGGIGWALARRPPQAPNGPGPNKSGHT